MTAWKNDYIGADLGFQMAMQHIALSESDRDSVAALKTKLMSLVEGDAGGYAAASLKKLEDLETQHALATRNLAKVINEQVGLDGAVRQNDLLAAHRFPVQGTSFA